MAELNRTYISGGSQIEGNLEVNGNAVINGDLTADNLNATGTINGASIEVTGDVKGNNIKATNSIETASIAATGVVQGASLSISGTSSLNTLTTSGKATVNSLGCTNSATVGGNLTVNGDITCKNFFKQIYPVGSIYETTSSTFDPNVTFGGTWSRIKGKVLVGVDEDDTDFATVSKTGGAKTHTLTESQLPQIDGNMTFHGQENGSAIYNVSGHFYGTNFSGKYKSPASTSGAYSKVSVGYKFGGGAAHNNLQPYYTVYIWNRTA